MLEVSTTIRVPFDKVSTITEADLVGILGKVDEDELWFNFIVYDPAQGDNGPCIEVPVLMESVYSDWEKRYLTKARQQFADRHQLPWHQRLAIAAGELRQIVAPPTPQPQPPPLPGLAKLPSKPGKRGGARPGSGRKPGTAAKTKNKTAKTKPTPSPNS
jgi:hypothetical protein